MNKKTLGAFAFLFLSLFLFSCHSKDKMILGTWIPLGPDGKKNDMMKIEFLENHTVVAHNKLDTGRPKDSISYEIRDDGKLLVTKEKGGRTDELVIVELNSKNLVMYVKAESRDTIRMVKE